MKPCNAFPITQRLPSDPARDARFLVPEPNPSLPALRPHYRPSPTRATLSFYPLGFSWRLDDDENSCAECEGVLTMSLFLRRLDEALKGLGVPIARLFGLPHLVDHFPTVVYSALGFTVLHLVIAPGLSRIFSPQTYGKQVGRKARNNWNIHIVSFVNATALVYLSFKCLNHPSLSEDRIFGWHESIGTANAVALGYFLWDTIDAIVNFVDIGFVIHGAACTLLYSLTFLPFLGYYSPRYLLWEMSTPFLNIHWFLDKFGMTGSIAQYVNGVFLLSTFFFVRIAYGWYMNYYFYGSLYDAWGRVHPLLILTLAVGNLVLNFLNIHWLGKMISALRKRFGGADAKPLLDPRPDEEAT